MPRKTDHDDIFAAPAIAPPRGEPHPSMRHDDDPPARVEKPRSPVALCSYYGSREGEQRHGTSDW